MLTSNHMNCIIAPGKSGYSEDLVAYPILGGVASSPNTKLFGRSDAEGMGPFYILRDVLS